ncbi:hypothetical protein [Deinococcus fonticola]|nr:hypothetical protein [Deinococcus fonticola]
MVLKQGLTEPRAHARAGLAGFKVPQSVQHVYNLPRYTANRILKG